MSKSNKKKNKKTSNVSQLNKQNIKSDSVQEENNEVVVDENTEIQTTEAATKEIVTDKKKNKEKDEKSSKNKKVQKKKNNKGDKKTFGQKCKAIFHELKLVVWPTFKEACKQTGIVLALVLIFGLILFTINVLMSGLFGLITTGNWVWFFD